MGSGSKLELMDAFSLNNSTIMSNPHAHPHTMRKTHAKFQNNWYKTVRGVALTRYPLSI